MQTRFVKVTHYRSFITVATAIWKENICYININQIQGFDFDKQLKAWVIYVNDGYKNSNVGSKREWKVDQKCNALFEKFVADATNVDNFNKIDLLLEKITKLVTEIQYHPFFGSKVPMLQDDFNKNT